MTQFDVFENPVTRARRAFPLVSVVQSELANTGGDLLVAPLAPRAGLAASFGRLTPHVRVADVEYVLLVPRMTPMRAADLRGRRGQLAAYRSEIVAALDYLFLGL